MNKKLFESGLMTLVTLLAWEMEINVHIKMKQFM